MLKAKAGYQSQMKAECISGFFGVLQERIGWEPWKIMSANQSHFLEDKSIY